MKKGNNLLKLIPATIRIKRDAIYEIVWVDEFPNDLKQVGECRSNPRQIVIKKNESPNETFKTFVHEVVHAINYEYSGLNITEKQTQLFEQAIFKLLKLNHYI